MFCFSFNKEPHKLLSKISFILTFKLFSIKANFKQSTVCYQIHSRQNKFETFAFSSNFQRSQTGLKPVSRFDVDFD